MKNVGGFYLPDSDRHFAALGDRLRTYQLDRIKKALKYVKNWDCAIDAGAHVGIHSRAIANRFKSVLSYEANEENYECLKLNVALCTSVTPYHTAIGLREASLQIQSGKTKNTGNRQIVLEGADGENFETVPGVSIDSLNIESLGFLKIDVQGFEPCVLKGAEETLKRCKPVVMFEEEPAGKLGIEYGFPVKSADILRDAGASIKERLGADQIWSFDE